jgi:hypothetical protein
MKDVTDLTLRHGFAEDTYWWSINDDMARIIPAQGDTLMFNSRVMNAWHLPLMWIHLYGYPPIYECLIRAKTPWSDISMIMKSRGFEERDFQYRYKGQLCSDELIKFRKATPMHFMWRRKDVDITENEFEMMRIRIRNCPALNLAFLPLDEPLYKLSNLLTERGAPEGTFELKFEHRKLSEKDLKDDCIIEFQSLLPITIRIKGCLQISEVSISGVKPWTDLKRKFAEMNLFPTMFRCLIHGKECSDRSLFDNCEINFELLNTDQEFKVFVKNCPTAKDCVVSAKQPWTDLKTIIEDSIQAPYECRTDGQLCTNENVFPGATIWFSFKLQGGNPDEEEDKEEEEEQDFSDHERTPK